jgi:hypothetical protein
VLEHSGTVELCQYQRPGARKSQPSTHRTTTPSVSPENNRRTYATYTQVYIIGGDGAHRGAQTLFDEAVGRRRLKVAIGKWLAFIVLCRILYAPPQSSRQPERDAYATAAHERLNEGDGKANLRIVSGLACTVLLMHDTRVVVAVKPSLGRTFSSPKRSLLCGAQCVFPRPSTTTSVSSTARSASTRQLRRRGAQSRQRRCAAFCHCAPLLYTLMRELHVSTSGVPPAAWLNAASVFYHSPPFAA